MSQHLTVDVWCDACDGTGTGASADEPVCLSCQGQRHVAVNRDEHGQVPDGQREYLPPMLPDLYDRNTLPAREDPSARTP